MVKEIKISQQKHIGDDHFSILVINEIVSKNKPIKQTKDECYVVKRDTNTTASKLCVASRRGTLFAIYLNVNCHLSS